MIAAAARARDPARTWSFAALVAGAFAAGGDAVLILSTQENVSGLNWPLLLLPVFLVPAPVIWPHRSTRIVAAIAMAGWCFIGTFSVGPLFLPCVLLMIGAALR